MHNSGEERYRENDCEAPPPSVTLDSFDVGSGIVSEREGI